MGEQPAINQWLRERRQQLRAEIGLLEDAVVEAGLTPPQPPATPESGEPYARLVGPYEAHATALRALLVGTGCVPPAVAPAQAQMHGAPSDWLERLAAAQQDAADARRQAAEAEARVLRADAARAAAETAHQRATASMPHLYAALSQMSGAAPAATTAHGGVPAESGQSAQMSTMTATRLVLQALGPNEPVTASQVGEAVQRMLGEPANPATIRTNLVRLRDATLSDGSAQVAHDEASSTWWLVDPQDPAWRPARLRAIASE